MKAIEIDIEEVRKLIEIGCSQNEIAQALLVCKNTVARFLRKHRLATKTRSGPRLGPCVPVEIKCLFCDKPTKRHGAKYCSNKCQQKHEWRLSRAQIEETGIANTLKGAKRYLTETKGYKCELCGIDEWQGQKLPLILDHIDGNAENWLLSNLRLVCSNCDSLLPTYKNKNKGRGRYWRRMRYHHEQDTIASVA